MPIINSNFEIRNSYELLTPIINKYLLEKHREEQNRKRTGGEKWVHPSSLVDPCWRRCYYNLNNYPTPPITPELLKIFRTGDAIHEMLQSWLEGAGVLIAKEYSMVDEANRLKGRLDAIALIENAGMIGEFKSIKDEKYRQLLELDEPILEHLKQINLYMHMINKMKLAGLSDPVLDKILAPIKRGILYYVSKIWIEESEGMTWIRTDTKPHKEFIVNYDERIVSALLDKAKFLLATTDPKKVDRGFERGSKECYFCNYNNKTVDCWED